MNQLNESGRFGLDPKVREIQSGNSVRCRLERQILRPFGHLLRLILTIWIQFLLPRLNRFNGVDQHERCQRKAVPCNERRRQFQRRNQEEN